MVVVVSLLLRISPIDVNHPPNPPTNHSGSGKSTVLALLQRFYDPAAGRVLYDGEDLRSFDLTWLRQQMAVVSQEPVLFGCSIFDNICYGVTARGGRCALV